MKRTHFLYIICLFLLPFASSAESLQSKYIRTWSFVKYTSLGKIDWDKKLIEDYRVLVSCRGIINKDSLIEKLFFVDKILLSKLEDTLNSVPFNKRLVKRNKHTGSPIFLEKKYFNNTEITKPLLFLSFARAWGLIRYYYVHLKQPNSWWNIIDKQLPSFLKAKNHKQHYLEACKLVNKINDGHSMVSSIHYSNYNSNLLPPFWLKRIQGKFYINSFKNDSIKKELNLKEGFEVISINNKLLSKQWLKTSTYFSSSNNEYANSRAVHLVLFSKSASNTMRYRNTKGDTLSLTIPFFEYNSKLFQGTSRKTKVQLPENTSYINFYNSSKRELKAFFKKNKSCKNIILDCRGYPEYFSLNEIQRFCGVNKKAFAIIQEPSYDSTNTKGNSFQSKIKKHSPTDNRFYVLVNHNTKSQMEYLVMALQANPKITVIGTKTAGANGNASKITLPLGVSFYISGSKVMYPDLSDCQINGVKIDIVIKNNLSEDQILKEAIRLISN